MTTSLDSLEHSATAEMTAPDWSAFARKALAGECLSRDDAHAVLAASDDDVLSMLDAAYRVRASFFGRGVKLNLLLNAKSGHCPENCGYCSQARGAKADINKYTLVDKATIVAGAKKAMEMDAGTYCIVCSGRGPTDKELRAVTDAVREIKATMPLTICACLGLLKDGQAEELKAAGVDRYNHNINSSANHHSQVTTSHTYDDRVTTVNHAKKAGISPCSGVIIGMGESDDDIIDMALALRELDADSIPVNFVVPVAGARITFEPDLTPMACLRVLCLFRFLCPSKEIRVSGGREVHLRALQPLALFAANSIFLGDYLTTPGQDAQDDYQMIADLGFEVDRSGPASA